MPARNASLGRILAPLGLVLAVVLCYANSFSGAFVLDDENAILRNPTLGGFASAIHPPAGEGLTVEGRPVLNVSLALNHAISGVRPWSYHALNLLVHLVATLTLFGLVRRTLAGAEGRAKTTLAPRSTAIAFGVALLWAVHPLQTESVTYVVQRTESLMGMFYLLTLYAFVRGIESGAGAWLVGSVLACAAGMATKEVMVSAPLLVWLYDRTFVAGGFAAAWRQRRGYYSALLATWIILAVLVVGAGDRGGTIGAKSGVEWWQYALTQSRGIVHYIGLGLWPTLLIFDYGADFVSWPQAWPYVALDGLILGVVGLAVWRKPPLGFVGAWFFLILAPTSSVVGGTRQMLADHRMYLSLAAILVLIVVGAWQWLGRRAWFVVGLLAFAWGMVTVRRNQDYRSERALYVDTVAKRPGNVHARYNLGKVLGDAQEWPAAIEQDEAALALAPNMAGAHYNLANALAEVGRSREAVTEYEAALRVDPRYAKAHYNLGNLLVNAGQKAEAAEHFRAAVSADPDFIEARDNLGSVLLDLGQLDAAKTEYLEVLRRNPDLVETHCNLGAIYYLQGKFAESAGEYRRALAINPRFEPALAGLARVGAASTR